MIAHVHDASPSLSQPSHPRICIYPLYTTDDAAEDSNIKSDYILVNTLHHNKNHALFSSCAHSRLFFEGRFELYHQSIRFGQFCSYAGSHFL